MSTAGLDHVITAAVLNWLLSGRDPVGRADPMSGRHYLDYATRYKGVVVGIVLLAAGLLAVGVAAIPECTPAQASILLLIFGAMFLGSLYLAHEAFLVQVSVSTEGLTRQATAEPDTFIPWSQVSTVHYSSAFSWFVFRALDGTVIRVSVYRGGLGTLQEVAHRDLGAGPAQDSLALLAEKSARPI